MTKPTKDKVCDGWKDSAARLHTLFFKLSGKEISIEIANKLNDFIKSEIIKSRKEGFDYATEVWAGKNFKKGVELSRIIEKAREEKEKIIKIELLRGDYKIIIEKLKQINKPICQPKTIYKKK